MKVTKNGFTYLCIRYRVVSSKLGYVFLIINDCLQNSPLYGMLPLVMVINICVSKLKPPKFYIMIADLKAVPGFQTEPALALGAGKNTRTILQSSKVKVKQFSKWINPKNWFSRFSTIDIDMSEFACKKTLPKE